jgi:hypothetical protein
LPPARPVRMSEALAIALSALISLVVGTFLILVPWTGLWEANYLLQPYLTLRMLVLSPFARGTVTGLGILNIVMGVHEAYQLLSARAFRR